MDERTTLMWRQDLVNLFLAFVYEAKFYDDHFNDMAKAYLGAYEAKLN